jgi:hypothetical protein
MCNSIILFVRLSFQIFTIVSGSSGPLRKGDRSLFSKSKGEQKINAIQLGIQVKWTSKLNWIEDKMFPHK